MPARTVERTGARRWAWRGVKALAGFLLAVHLYAMGLRFLPVPGTIVMVQRMIEGETLRRERVSLDEISPHLVDAVIAAEDTRFCQHRGIDTAATRKAIAEYRAGKGLRGASTITQQTAKNVFFWNGGGLARKAGEAWMSALIDIGWGKPRVMTAYLNVAEWGDGLFGAEAAAQARFAKPASDLTQREAALLAAVLPNPNTWRLDPPGPYVRKRAATLLARMETVRRKGLADCVLASRL